MKTSSIVQFRHKLASGDPLYGLTITAGSTAAITDIAAAIGLDWILLDADQLGPASVAEHVRAAKRSNTVVFVRQLILSSASAERIISIGADGILTATFGWEEESSNWMSPAALRPAIGHAVETRPLLAALLQEGDDHHFLNRLLDSSSIDIIFLQGHTAPATEQRLQLIHAAGKHAGLSSGDERDLIAEHERGFQILGFGTDTGILFQELQGALAAARDVARETTLDASASEDR